MGKKWGLAVIILGGQLWPPAGRSPGHGEVRRENENMQGWTIPQIGKRPPKKRCFHGFLPLIWSEWRVGPGASGHGHTHAEPSDEGYGNRVFYWKPIQNGIKDDHFAINRSISTSGGSKRVIFKKIGVSNTNKWDFDDFFDLFSIFRGVPPTKSWKSKKSSILARLIFAKLTKVLGKIDDF